MTGNLKGPDRGLSLPGSGMTKSVLGIIGGSGIYDLPGLENVREESLASPFGEPSGALRIGDIAGLPVVSFDVGGAREVVIPGTTGFLIPRDDTSSLIESVAQLVGDRGLREAMGAEGRRRFTDQFRYQTMTRRIREVYAQVLAR